MGSGRVWSGKKAKEIGLVDEIGTLNDAIKYAANRVKLKEYEITSYPAKMDKFEMIFSNIDEENITNKLIKSQIGEENYQLFKILSEQNIKNTIQMAMPYTFKIK